MKKAMRLITILLIVAMLAVPVYAAIANENFTPSVSQKGAPRIINFRDADGNEYPAAFVNEKGEIVGYVPQGGIEIKSLGDVAAAAEGDHAKAMIEWGYKTLSENSMADAVPGLAEALKAAGFSKTTEDTVVYELFHIAVAPEYQDQLAAGNKLMVKLAQKNTNIDFEMVIHAINKDDEWVKDEANTESFTFYVMDTDALTYDESGARVLTIEEGCLYGLLTDKK